MRERIANQIQTLMSRPKPTIQSIASKLNFITGFQQVSDRKDSVLLKDRLLAESKSAYELTKLEHDSIANQRRDNQKSLDLLRERKAMNKEDINTLTELYKTQLNLESLERASKANLKTSMEHVEKSQAAYLSEMRERYSEEQMFSDKIKYASSYYTWILILTQSAIFLVVQLVIEPRRRRNIVQLVEDNGVEMKALMKELEFSIAITLLNSKNPTAPLGSTAPANVQENIQKDFRDKLKSTISSTEFASGIGLGLLFGALGGLLR